uniref:Magnesium transporter n=1 Tax=Pyramimonas obovata TaxID=1411642 RepID=A0A7S0WIG7_9CHLO|mmetsp:Transcript_26797/g.58393  ORF Transcript_26797/g.58393 Transcript_26797/m.58393 type:complete len:645 (+) Transcript_26797:416-2350(+)|eukprot:CAMPEP_0118921576 /NCGR_PEP_ID=MMETSP1169-20130426/805_1 /TAXON_ID=36882 /ORGANISM="Pyramimonas obovata, Strain CCMP722" /LENGTH=644 /DNA_ID=CAMNT_0006862323 /DNA_START=397 /DNA_END=2331 /DNA_ORIENTATION=+
MSGASIAWISPELFRRASTTIIAGSSTKLNLKNARGPAPPSRQPASLVNSQLPSPRPGWALTKRERIIFPDARMRDTRSGRLTKTYIVRRGHQTRQPFHVVSSSRRDPPPKKNATKQPNSKSNTTNRKVTLRTNLIEAEGDVRNEDDDEVQEGLEEIVQGVKLDRYFSLRKDGLDFVQRSRMSPIYDIVEVNKAGSMDVQRVARRQLLQRTHLQPRDLRRIDPFLSLTTTAPVIVVLGNALLVHVGAIRLAIFKDYCILFNVHSKVSKRFLRNLTSRLESWSNAVSISKEPEVKMQGNSVKSLTFTQETSSADALFLSDGSDIHSSMSMDTVAEEGWGELSTPGDGFFEMEVLEVALLDAITELEVMLSQSTKRVDRMMRILPAQISAVALEELRNVKQELVELESRASAMREMLLDVLDDDEDVQNMLISRSGVERSAETLEEDEEEVEGLLEYYLQRSEAYHSEAERLLENTRDLEESIAVSLSARRFEVNKLELWLSVASFAVAVGALVSGIFGMNLLSGLETAPRYFWMTSCAIVVGIFIITSTTLVYLYRRLRHTQVNPSKPSRNGKNQSKKLEGWLKRKIAKNIKKNDFMRVMNEHYCKQVGKIGVHFGGSKPLTEVAVADHNADNNGKGNTNMGSSA